MYTSKNSTSLLDYQGIYPCPVCRLGKIKSLSLMEAFGCDCGKNIFTADLEKQLIKMPTIQPPLTWYWNGKCWQRGQLEGREWKWYHWLLVIGFIVLPTALVALSAYIFPATPGSNLSWLPTIWVGLAFLFHLGIVGWLIIEFYQFPFWTYLRISWRFLLER